MNHPTLPFHAELVAALTAATLAGASAERIQAIRDEYASKRNQIPHWRERFAMEVQEWARSQGVTATA